MRIPFVGPAYRSQSLNINAQRCVNFIPEVDPQDGKSVMALIGRPGLRLFVYLGAEPIRVNGTHVLNSIMYAVMGSKLFSVLGNATYSHLGTLLTSSGAVSMADNGTQIMIVDGSHGYIYNINTGAFTQIADADFTGADTVTFMDGYFIVNKPGTGSFMISALYDGLAWSALDVATAEGDPDKLLAVITDHREVWLLGEYTTEVWFDSGASDFPFERKGDVVIEKGLTAVRSTGKLDNSLFWLAQDRNGRGYVVRMEGYTPRTVSTRALEAEWARYGTISDAIAFTFTYNGHPLYMLTFPTGNATWVYDASTNLWHEWSSYDVGKFRGGAYAFFLGKHYFGDYLDGDIYELSDDTYHDNYDPIEGIRTTQHIHNEMRPLFFRRLTVDMETGVGTNEAVLPAEYLADGTYHAGGEIAAVGAVTPSTNLSGLDPVAMLRWSDDGGHTWSSQRTCSIGKTGEYKKRVQWNRLGYTNNSRTFELKITDPVKRVIIDAFAEVAAGR